MTQSTLYAVAWRTRSVGPIRLSFIRPQLGRTLNETIERQQLLAPDSVSIVSAREVPEYPDA